MSLIGGVKATGEGGPISWPRGFYANLVTGLSVLVRPARAKVQSICSPPIFFIIGAMLAVFLIAAFMLSIDAPLADIARRSPRWLVQVFEQVSEFGKSGWFLWPLGLALLALAATSSLALTRISRFVLASVAVRLGFLFTAIAVPSLFATIIKRLIGRARPHVGGFADPFSYMPFAWRPDYASLPSGHATTAFAAATAIGLLWPRARPWVIVYAVAVAVSRIVLHAHFASDVIAGAMVGTLGAFIVRDWFAARHLGFFVDADGNIRTLPGPGLTRIKRVARTLMAP